VIRSCSRAFANASDRPKIRDYNPGPVLPIPGLGIEFFCNPRISGYRRDCPGLRDLADNMGFDGQYVFNRPIVSTGLLYNNFWLDLQ